MGPLLGIKGDIKNNPAMDQAYEMGKNVGAGSTTEKISEQRQWYVLDDIVSMGQDSPAMQEI